MAQELEITPFTTDHLGAAAALLAQRQMGLRAVRPELPPGFTEAAGCRPLLAALLEVEGAHGVVATRRSGIQAFLIGFPRHEPIWGRACWSPIERQAYDASVGPDVMRDLYASWSRHFVDRGFFRQYVHAPADWRTASLPAHRTWTALGFKPTDFRLHRHIDERIVWAGGRPG